VELQSKTGTGRLPVWGKPEKNFIWCIQVQNLCRCPTKRLSQTSLKIEIVFRNYLQNLESYNEVLSLRFIDMEIMFYHEY